MIIMIGFLFLIKDGVSCPKQWEHFFDKIHHSRYEIYVHAKNPNLLTRPWLKENLCSHQVVTRWGDISLVKATYCLLHDAYQNPKIDQFVLISDSCIPIVNFDTFAREIQTSRKSWIHYKHMSNKLDRYRSISPCVAQELPFSKFYSQYQWMMLQRRHVKISLDYSHWISFFSRVPAVDEHYFVSLFTYLGILKKEFENRKLTYCDWSTNPLDMHPREFKIIDKKFIRKVFIQERCLLLRKVHKDCKFV